LEVATHKLHDAAHQRRHADRGSRDVNRPQAAGRARGMAMR